ncbi:uncharacterized protein G2W53_009575 [Senna tora]|uniref:Uncharacterized protein n=1 Tax=Senna tora TaxID=362788 RepID=A0A835C881_9FABA|nr:uncharacterized protein G2W53_009575 [Senna tora]
MAKMAKEHMPSHSHITQMVIMAHTTEMT